MKKMFAAIAALSVSAGVFAADAANTTNEVMIGATPPAHGPESAHTMPERGSMGSSGTAAAYTPYGQVSAIHSNEGTITVDPPVPLMLPATPKVEQSTELKIGPAAPAHGPESANQGR